MFKIRPRYPIFGFYFLVSTLLLSLAVSLVAYLFPDKKRKFLGKWKIVKE
jgi:hypothetical protein